MKQLYTLSALLMLTFSVRSQQIISMTTFPANPDDNDTVYVYIDQMFPYSACTGTAYFSQTGNDIYSSSMHCMGMLTAICNDVDTLKLNPMAAGTYNVYHTLSSGYGGWPCSPGIVPDDTDTLTFIVTSTSGITEVQNLIKGIYPNPAKETCVVEIGQNLINACNVVVTDNTGRIVLTQPASQNRITLDIKNLSAGSYLVRLMNNETSYGVGKLIKE